jgi:5-oxoprolinase (ATP-hydrolysing) subunit A
MVSDPRYVGRPVERKAVTLNVDLGELAEEPEELYRLATVVNVACGGHAGDEASMARAVALAAASGAMVAAHPSYPDRAGFGRKTIVIDRDELCASIAAQCEALARVAAAGGASAAAGVAVATGGSGSPGVSVTAGVVRAVKLHGALYHDAARDPVIAEVVMEGAARGLGTRDLVWIGPARSEVWRRAREAGLAYVREGFADRGAFPDGSLLPRGRPGAMIEEPERAAERAVELARSGEVETICVHSDTRGAVAIARAVRAALEGSGLLGAPAGRA